MATGRNLNLGAKPTSKAGERLWRVPTPSVQPPSATTQSPCGHRTFFLSLFRVFHRAPNRNEAPKIRSHLQKIFSLPSISPPLTHLPPFPSPRPRQSRSPPFYPFIRRVPCVVTQITQIPEENQNIMQTTATPQQRKTRIANPRSSLLPASLLQVKTRGFLMRPTTYIYMWPQAATFYRFSIPRSSLFPPSIFCILSSVFCILVSPIPPQSPRFCYNLGGI